MKPEAAEWQPLMQKDLEQFTPLILEVVRRYSFTGEEGVSLETFERLAGTFELFDVWDVFTTHLRNKRKFK